MHKTMIALMSLAAAGVLLMAAAPSPPEFDGQKAYDLVRAQTDMGVRAPLTPGHDQCATWLQEQMDALHLKVSLQKFAAQPEDKPIPMVNVVGTMPGKSPDVILIGAHWDSKTFKDIRFVGANDGGSGIGVLLELARVLAPGAPYGKTIQFAAFDGEESVDDEPVGVGLYGSTHFVREAAHAHETIKAFILLDMIGDQSLDINTDQTSDTGLHQLIWAEARREGVQGSFNGPAMQVMDDHTPFLNAHIPSIDLIDFQYGSAPGLNDYWHTDKDTLDKINPTSLQTVGRVVEAVVRKLAQ